MTTLGTDTPLEQNNCNLSFWWSHGMLNLIHVNRGEQGTIIAWYYAKLLLAESSQTDLKKWIRNKCIGRIQQDLAEIIYLWKLDHPRTNYELYSLLYYANNSVYKSIINYYKHLNWLYFLYYSIFLIVKSAKALYKIMIVLKLL